MGCHLHALTDMANKDQQGGREKRHGMPTARATSVPKRRKQRPSPSHPTINTDTKMGRGTRQCRRCGTGYFGQCLCERGYRRHSPRGCKHCGTQYFGNGMCEQGYKCHRERSCRRCGGEYFGKGKCSSGEECGRRAKGGEQPQQRNRKTCDSVESSLSVLL